MPKSKRNKQISLTRTDKSGMVMKKRLIEEVRSCVENYANIFVYSVNDMRNNKLKQVREQWKHSRFFFGKNNVMALALGKTVETECKANLHQISNKLKGQCGLLFSNKSKEEVLTWFDSFLDSDYSRSGNIAQYAVKLPEGPLPQFPHSLEPYLRQLGMPTSLQKGIVHLVKDYVVCKEGDTLTPETAKILKLLGYQMAEFRISIECCWTNDGTFHEIEKSADRRSSVKENIEMDIDSENEECSKNENKDTYNSKDIISNIECGNVGVEEPVIQIDEQPCSDALEISAKALTIEREKNAGEEITCDDKISACDDNSASANTVSPNKNQANDDVEVNDDENDLNSEDSADEDIQSSDEDKEDIPILKLETGKLNVSVKSSSDEKSPLYRSLRSRTVKVERKKAKK